MNRSSHQRLIRKLFLTCPLRTSSIPCLGLVVWLQLIGVCATSLAWSRPTAIIPGPAGQSLLIGDSTGRILWLELESKQLLAAADVATSLADLAALPRSKWFIAVDDQSHELMTIEHRDHSFAVHQRITMPAYPKRIAVSVEGSRVCVSCLWSQCVCLFEIKDAELSLRGTVDLPFPPLEVLAISDNQFVVTDAFGGRIAVIGQHGDVVAMHALQGHNIRGLLLDTTGEHVYLTHQVISRVARADFADIHWGMLMQNVITRLPWSEFVKPDGDLTEVAQQFRLGDTGHAAADPAGMAAVSDHLAIALAGTDEVCLIPMNNNDARQLDIQHARRVPVGYRPLRLAVSPDGTRVVAANSLSGSLSVIELNRADAVRPEHITVGDERHKITAEQRGEVAFFSARLAHDQWLTCHSCHSDGHSPDLLADTLSDGSYGTPKRIPSLLGVAQTMPWGWRGQLCELHEQVEQSISSTMHGQVANAATAADIVAFLQTLRLPTIKSLSSAATLAAGRATFARLDCAECHALPYLTTAGVYNVGLADEEGVQEFNPPSLRGLRYRRAFFHDGRAASLADVIDVHHHQVPPDLSAEERDSLIEYLLSL